MYGTELRRWKKQSFKALSENSDVTSYINDLSLQLRMKCIYHNSKTENIIYEENTNYQHHS